MTTVPESWYSANVIKDGTFSPKPISELFSTNIDTFSTANPIIVLPPSTPNPLLSSSIQTSLDPFLSSTFSTGMPPLLSFSNDPSTFQTFSTTVPPPPPPSSPAVTLQFTQSTPPPFRSSPPNPPNIQYIICPSCQPASNFPVSITTATPAPSVTTSPISLSTARPFPSTFPSQTPCAPNTQVTQRPISTARPGYPYIRIRMFSSRGVPIVANLPRSTTPRTTTTRRPRKNRRNNYGACVDACGRRNPICAAPLATRPITSDSLKGFPSICHMSCFNSFNKNRKFVFILAILFLFFLPFQ